MKNCYSFNEIIVNIYSLIWTKIFMPQCRLIRRPSYFRGRKSLKGAKFLTTGRFCRYDLEGRKKTLFVGDNCQFGDMTHIVALNRVSIGNNVLIASKVFISDTNHGSYAGNVHSSPDIPPKDRDLVSSSVEIGNNVWIGENAVILPGAIIGNGSIVGANSVVSKEIPECSIVAGVNTVIKKYSYSEKKWVKQIT